MKKWQVEIRGGRANIIKTSCDVEAGSLRVALNRALRQMIKGNKRHSWLNITIEEIIDLGEIKKEDFEIWEKNDS